MIRTGIGQDSHKFSEEPKKLVIGAVEIPGEQGLKANSDGDVILHGICNALASSVGKGSISTYADKLCLEQGITDSKEYLKVANSFVKDAGFSINNISISIEAKRPKLESHISAMKKAIAEILNIKEDQIGITATSGEDLTAFGRGEGIQAIAIATISDE